MTPPVRTFSMTYKDIGYIEFSIPVSNPQDVEAYLLKKLADLPVVERMTLHDDLMKIATEMWDGYCLWVGDPTEARNELRDDEEVSRWLRAKE